MVKEVGKNYAMDDSFAVLEGWTSNSKTICNNFVTSEHGSFGSNPRSSKLKKETS